MNDTTDIQSSEIAPKRRSRLADFFTRMVREKPLGTASGIIVFILIFVAIFADSLAPFPYKEMHLADRLTGPSAQYLLGTDHLGRDFLSRIIYGARISLVVGLAATAVNVVAALLGGASRFIGGKSDLIMQRFVDAWMSFPGLLLLLTIMSIVGRGIPQIILPGYIRRHRRLKSRQRRRYRHKGERLLPGGAGNWQPRRRDTGPACTAQYHGPGHHHLHHQHRGSDHQ